MVPVTIARHECKYRIAVDLLPRLVDAIGLYCEPDRYATTGPDGLYTIDSLYYDSDDMRLFWLSEEGASHRSKVRVRSYLGPAGRSATVKLEVKMRRGPIVTKTSASLPLNAWAHAVRHPSEAIPLRDAEQRAAFDRFAMEVVQHRAVPKMMVRYQRAAFFSRLDDYVRITFDRRIQAQVHRDHDFDTVPERWLDIDDAAAHGGASHVIMEAKFKQVPPSWLVDIARRFDLSQRSFSKYGNAVRRALLERHDGWGHRVLPRAAAPWFPGLAPARWAA